MPRAEAGSSKSVANKLKAAGLGRLRWYCQVCEKQCRDDNGFKCHVASEAHVRKIQSLGSSGGGGGAKKAIDEYSSQFRRDFIQLLRTAHGEKKVHLNHFYQEYIQDKHHIHMNATKWNSLTEFGKFLGREGICRVTEDEEKGVFISWIDDSPEALRRQEAIKKRERQDKGDEALEERMIREQIERANEKRRREEEDVNNDERRKLVREEGKKIQLNFSIKKAADAKPEEGKATALEKQPGSPDDGSNAGSASDSAKENKAAETSGAVKPVSTGNPLKMSMKPAANGKPKNVFAAAKGEKRKGAALEAAKGPMSNAQRIMMEEQAKRRRVQM
jgi:DNA/RNA-binding protein KIN17